MTSLKKTVFTATKRFRAAGTVEKILMTFSILLILDILLVVLGGSYLSENVITFLGKPKPIIFSDLLFIEGSIIFAVGAFLMIIIQNRPSPNRGSDTKQSGKKRIHPGVFLMIVGASLIGLSIAVGTIFFR